MDSISIKFGGYTREVTPKELEILHNDYMFMMDAILVLINEKACAETDMGINKENVLEWAKDFYYTRKQSGANKDFLDKVFQK
jgi:hypothetical protein